MILRPKNIIGINQVFVNLGFVILIPLISNIIKDRQYELPAIDDIISKLNRIKFSKSDVIIAEEM